MQANIFPFYPQPRTPFKFDTKIIEIIIICIVTACTFIIILPGIRGKSRSIWLLRILTSLFIGAVILAVNFTSDWEMGTITATTVYKSFSHSMLNASIGLWIGLKGLNITLIGNPEYQLNETINYNEEFAWESANQFETSYKDALERGLPFPIVYVAEKFTISSDCGLFQQYCISTYYSSGIMWIAFCSWILYNVLFSMPVILYGIYMMFVTAICMLVSLISFASVRKAPVCNIQFGNSILKTHFGVSYWLSLITGLLCLIISLVLLFLYKTQPKVLQLIFSYGEEEDLSNKSENEEEHSSVLSLNEIL
ncbi:dual oxidase maturation factor 1 [Xenopus laevis]|uniref:Dual oxidase maturation factor 1 n=1 Tax=Xenopus laevis TaxID=8355 RepID=DOXA1_XENLA|nr:dual oxidase maturation factor 1 [Xenopus laevis]Q6DDK3.1 RecName: Full=Dual oxidase maturation factor 1; AltName: Full=Dual oxidase activator 1 [Xenopus laevis]AAH77555.1 MGC83502 protein [Xenopus laevis]